MKNIIFKWKVVMDDDAYLWGGAHDIQGVSKRALQL
jgi:hypothetical protein